MKRLYLAIAVCAALCIPVFAGDLFEPESLNWIYNKTHPKQSPLLGPYVTANVDLWDVMTQEKRLTLSPRKIQERNDWILQQLESNARESLHGFGITAQEAQALIDEARNHPVVGIKALDHYDPAVSGERNLGFCYGRADYLYLRLLSKGVPSRAVLKLFDMGDIWADPTYGAKNHPWPYHVATIVKAKDANGWYALDPFYGIRMTPAEWVKTNRSKMTDPHHPPAIYLSDPKRGFVFSGSDLPSELRHSAVAADNYSKRWPTVLGYFVDMWGSKELGGEAAVSTLLGKP